MARRVASSFSDPEKLPIGASGPQNDAPNIALMALLFEAGLAVAAVALGWLVGQPPLAGTELRWAALPELAVGAAWGTAAAMPMLAGLWLIERFPIGPLRELRTLVAERVVPLFAGVSVGQMACISLMAGLGEELLFRGVLQRAIGSWAGGSWAGGPWSVEIGLVAAAAAFGMCHWLSFTYAVLAALIGAYLGWVYLAAGEQLLAPITAHALYDFVALIYLVRPSRRVA